MPLSRQKCRKTYRQKRYLKEATPITRRMKCCQGYWCEFWETASLGKLILGELPLDQILLLFTHFLAFSLLPLFISIFLNRHPSSLACIYSFYSFPTPSFLFSLCFLFSYLHLLQHPLDLLPPTAFLSPVWPQVSMSSLILQSSSAPL